MPPLLRQQNSSSSGWKIHYLYLICICVSINSPLLLFTFDFIKCEERRKKTQLKRIHSYCYYYCCWFLVYWCHIELKLTVLFIHFHTLLSCGSKQGNNVAVIFVFLTSIAIVKKWLFRLANKWLKFSIFYTNHKKSV